MLKLPMLALVTAASLAGAQPRASARPLGTWDVEYERTVQQHMVHTPGEPTQVTDRGRMTLRAAGDSLFGELALDDPDSTKMLLRGTAKGNAWAVYVEQARPTGIAVIMIPIDAAMEWLKENIHGMQPVVVRFDLTSRADSLTGTRTVTGGFVTTARTSAVKGARRRP